MIVRLLFIASMLAIGVFAYSFYTPATFPVPPIDLKPLTTKPATPTLTIGWVGDMVPSDVFYNSIAFTAVKDELEKPDLMIGNLESTFATPDRLSKCRFILSQCHAFTGDATFADALKFAGFDFISLVNNHSYDYGTNGLRDTELQLERVGLPYISPNKPNTSIIVQGKRIGIIGLSSTPPQETINNIEYIENTVRKYKENHDMVVIVFHGGAEGSDKTIVLGTQEYMGTENRGNVELVAHRAIDAGADLVLGSGPHVLRKIEWYENKPIAYSLGNFIGGNQKLTTMGTLGLSGIFTATFENNIPTSYDFISVLLTKNGIPSIDPTEQSKTLIESL